MMATADTGSIEELLARRIGLDTASIGHDEVRRAVRRRMVEAGCETLPQYLERLDEGDEWDELVELVLVPETWFFREPAAFTLLDARARQHAASERSRLFRVLSMPCSTGAEPYSIAMTLREAGLCPGRFRVEAFDLSRRALDVARQASYGERAVRHVAPRLLRHYFVAGDGAWEVSRDARRGVHFSRGNVVDPGVLRDEAPFDVVFCRNVLIYLDDRARRRLMDTLVRALRDDGVLITGHAETANVVAPHFVSAGVPRTFAYVKRRPEGFTGHRSTTFAETRKDIAAGRARPAAGAASAEPHVPQKRRAPHAGVPTAPPGGGRDAGLDQARQLADAGRLVEAIAAARRWVAAHPASVEGHFLVGVAASAAGRFDAAEQALRRVLYLDPGHEAALAHLADLRERAGDRAEADRLRRRARRTAGEGARR